VKGIIVSEGGGARLRPVTRVVPRPLIPIYNKPLIYYTLSLLMLAGIRDILFVGPPEEASALGRLLGSGDHLGLRIGYAFEPVSDRAARLFLTAAHFIGTDSVALAYCDSILYGQGLSEYLQQAGARQSGATLFAHRARAHERYGVVEFGATGQAIRLEDRPTRSASPWAIIGLAFYDNGVLDVIARLKRSSSGELEITDVNAAYMEAGTLHVEQLGRGIAWFNAETHEALLQASSFIEMIEERQGFMVACVEEIAYSMGYIGADDVRRLAGPMRNNTYGQYLLRLVDGDS
jgi:glucose-1-phosphate thymidylyltransferase